MRISQQLALVVLTGCASNAAPEPPLVAVDDVVSDSGGYNLTVLAHGTTPARGDQSAELVVTTTAGAPVDDLTIALVPWMPAMGHGASVTPVITGLGSGVYAVDNLDLYMAGVWQLRATFADPPDHAAPQLEVE